MTATAGVIALGLLSFGGAASVAHADTAGPINFEFPGYAIASVDEQGGWSSTGAYDQGVVASTRFASFGGQSLRISSAVTSGGFGDQTFSPAILNPAGESTPQKHFDSTFQIGTTQDELQPGLHMSVSPDNGSGARMSYLRFEDQSDGVHVFFDDTTDAGPLGTVATFSDTDIATLSRTSAHTIRFSIDFFTGRANDVVKIYLDGALKATGTTWEDFYRYDPEQVPNQVPSVSKLLFRESGVAAAVTPGGGFLFDDVVLTSSAADCAFVDDATNKSKTLTSDCATDHTIVVPDGYTLDGAGFTVTAVDPAVNPDGTGGHFLGAVVKNAGAIASVKNLTVTASNLTTACDAFPDSLAGIRLDGASGSITNNTVTGIQQGANGDGCQEGNAIEVRNTEVIGTPSVNVTGNTVSDYQKTGVLVKGQVSAEVTDNKVTGYGPVNFIGQNGIQVSAGATAHLGNNKISDNFYSPKSVTACGLLIYQAGGLLIDKTNAFSGNEKDVCTYGKGGTFKLG